MQIFPIFIPETDCPYNCGFCNPSVANGPCAISADPDAMMVQLTDWLSTGEAGNGEQREVAFYGGTFTWGGSDRMAPWLEPLQVYVRSGRISGIRVSTRPDRLPDETISWMKEHGVTSVEIGLQSLDDRVLLQLNRSHTAEQGMESVRRCRATGLVTGIHLMTGSPAESDASWKQTVEKSVELKPDTVRIHPLLILAGTSFAQRGLKPLPDDIVLERLTHALVRFAASDIPVIRIGLQATDALMEPGAVEAGLFHPALRHVVMTRIYGAALKSGRFSPGDTVRVHPSHLSHATGYCGINRRESPGLSIVGDPGVSPWTLKSDHTCYHILSEGLT